jgi:hypothetical protein
VNIVSDRSTLSTPDSSADVAVSETLQLISSDKVGGTSVYDPEGNSLGSIYTLMIDKISGRVAYAVLSFGGFLGIGEHYHPLPWASLTYDVSRDGYVVSVSREQLEAAPRYGASDRPWSDPRFGGTVSDYWGI